LDANEECDDANNISGDGCSQDCLIEKKEEKSISNNLEKKSNDKIEKIENNASTIIDARNNKLSILENIKQFIVL
jgi:cysteine-rich repeat protein